MSNKVYILIIIGILGITVLSQTRLRQGFGGQGGGEAVVKNNEIKNSPQKISTKDYFEKIKIYFLYLGERIIHLPQKNLPAQIKPADQPASLYADPKASPY